jgi:hypothetical protein
MPAVLIKNDDESQVLGIRTCVDCNEEAILFDFPDINDHANWIDCGCKTCREMVIRRNEPGAQEDAEFMERFTSWFDGVHCSRFVASLFTRQCKCSHHFARDASVDNIFEVFALFGDKYDYFFVDNKISSETSLLSKFVRNIGGRGNMCPFYVAQCTIDAHYFYGQRYTTQSPIFGIYNAKKEQIGVGDDYDMQHLDMAKRAAIEEASLLAWFDVARVPVTLRSYIPQE